jgi:hypothetical protein
MPHLLARLFVQGSVSSIYCSGLNPHLIVRPKREPIRTSSDVVYLDTLDDSEVQGANFPNPSRFIEFLPCDFDNAQQSETVGIDSK